MSSLPPITQGQMALDPENQIIYYRDSNNELKAVTLKWIQDSVSSIENTDSISINGDLVIGGNLTVNGTTVTLNAETMYVEDNIIILNYGYTGAPILDAGIEVERGDSINVQIRWNELTDKWQFTNDGSNYLNIVGKDSAGNVSVGNANLGNLATANYFSGNAANLFGIPGANVTGTVANATHASTANTVVDAAQSNITSVGTLNSWSYCSLGIDFLDSGLV